MNFNQVLGLLKPLLAGAIPIVAFLVEYGVPKDKAALIALGALVVLLAVWGFFSHRDSAALKQVADMPEVSQILTTPANSNTPVAKATASDEGTLTKVQPLPPAQGPKT